MTKKVSLDEKEIEKIKSYWTHNSLDNPPETGIKMCLDHLEKKLDDGLTTPLSNYVIIRCVADIETFFKSSAILMIDSGMCRLPDVNITTSLEDLKLLEHVTLGKIAAEQFNLQNIYEIDKLFSGLLETKFLDSVKKDGVDVKTLLELINLRHKIVHELQNFHGTFEELMEYVNATSTLTTQSSLWFLDIFGPDYNDIGD